MKQLPRTPSSAASAAIASAALHGSPGCWGSRQAGNDLAGRRSASIRRAKAHIALRSKGTSWCRGFRCDHDIQSLPRSKVRASRFNVDKAKVAVLASRVMRTQQQGTRSESRR